MSELNIDFVPDQITKVGLVLEDGGDGALPYSQRVTMEFESGTWDSDTLNVFVAAVADQMKDMFGYSNPKVNIRVYQGGVKIGGGRV